MQLGVVLHPHFKSSARCEGTECVCIFSVSLAHRYAIFLCSLDVEIEHTQGAIDDAVMPPFPPYCTYLVSDLDQIWQKLVALCVGWDGGGARAGQ